MTNFKKFTQGLILALAAGGSALALGGCFMSEPKGIAYVPNPPTVIHTAPANLETGVALDRAVTATFSASMASPTLNDSTFLLLRATGPGFDTVPGVVTYDAGDSTATFTPDDSLLPSQTYVARLLHGITNITAECDTLADTSWTFTTPEPACVENSFDAPPYVRRIAPPALDNEVALDAVITVTFSERMDPSTINTSTFFLLNTDTAPPDTIAGTVTLLPGDTAATFTPLDSLAPGTNYEAVITPPARDRQCSPLGSAFRVPFTTAVAPPTPVLDTTDFGPSDYLAVYWRQSTGATTYHLQVSTSPLFTTLAHDQPGIPDPAFFMVEGRIPYADIPPGTYYWRVSASGPGGTSNWSPAKSFTNVNAPPP
jgi:hypothetical protein